jgi:5-methylcytosine-specific restriction endonuclease McrA
MDTLVLSSAYQPMHHVRWQDAISMWFAGRVEIVSVYEDRFIKTVDDILNVPSIVRFIGNVLKRFQFNRVVKFSRDNVFLRDEGKCQYCSKQLTKQNFTLDHIVPVSQGGKKVWQNIVTCCIACNQRKGNKSVKQAGMKLQKNPIIPKELIIGRENIFSTNTPEEWKDYL